MIWAILTGLLIYVLIGFLLINWATGDLTLSTSYPGEVLLLVVLWPFCLKGLLGMRFMRAMMQNQLKALEAWAKSGKQEE
ncbi:hypothetical protein A2890_02690 [candidate division WWE3 bacterium RIFCSPLOWO2_01_FULL_53_14]|uniref:DUF4282 domain-containing protein n=1 Tax=candidate division WWE3 bacterium RIFCSPLOWO2_01_FULL_53_14 TaxID=1802628 RepID=A0A1F4VRG0_UNCKA|nr:MAG: hypothetical protein A2890_02690 [candidate division WWE3 bacterium RIFCSPLOWO2_01_FULL_53_14]